MDSLLAACEDCLDYPGNLTWDNRHTRQLKVLHDRLCSNDSRLFHSETKAKVEFRDYGAGVFTSHTVCDISGMRENLGIASGRISKLPKCRFIFCRSTHSREKLKITREMFTIALSFHQVMPDFLEYVNSFGVQEQREDFHFSSFRSHCQLDDPTVETPLADIGVTGKKIQICYNLKTVERTTYQDGWPWSLRQCALHHSYDVGSGQTTWFILEASSNFSKRIASVTGRNGLPRLKRFESTAHAYATSLATHLVFCEGAVEEWRWYLNFLEHQCNEMTTAVLLKRVEVTESPSIDESKLPSLFSTVGMISTNQPRAGRVSTKRPTTTTSAIPGEHQPYDAPPMLEASNPSPSAQMGHQRAGSTRNSSQKLESVNESPCCSKTAGEVTFEDLQKIQHIEEAVCQASLLINLNERTFDQLVSFYSGLDSEPGWRLRRTENCKAALLQFQRCLYNLRNDCEIQRLRCETMSKLLADRKSLAHGIFDVQVTESNKRMAFDSQLISAQAQLSANRMEAMTRDMNEIAKKTKLETVSMRIITLVTLFFLPGTYISTLMSTDIIRFEKMDGRTTRSIFQLKALQVYFALSVPLVIVTLFASYAFYRWEVVEDSDKARLDPEKHTEALRSKRNRFTLNMRNWLRRRPV